MKKLTFPNMYKSDFLEVLWILKREDVQSENMQRALEYLASKMKVDSTWELERSVKDLIIPIGKRNYGNELITNRAKEVVEYYQKRTRKEFI